MALIETTRGGRPYYIVRWNYHRDPDGRKRYDERAFRRRTDATAFNNRKTAGTTRDTERITISEICDEWLEQHVSTLELRTQKFYEGEVRLRIRPYLGRKRASRLTPKDVSRWRKDVAADHSPHATNKALRSLKAMLRWARREGLTETHAAEGLKRLTPPARERAKAYTPDEVQRIADAAARLRDATLILTAAYTGLRRGELLALRWEDIDLDTGRIHVRRALDINNNAKAPKTTNARRTVEALTPAWNALREWREHCPRTIHVFPSTTDRPLANIDRDVLGRKSTHRAGATRIRQASGIDVELNQLRDTYASLIISAGASDYEVMRAMGHESIATTYAHYADLLESRKAGIRQRANEHLATL